MSNATPAEKTVQAVNAPVKSAPNPGQERAISAPGNWGIRVIAGAGTGKTFLMSRRFIRLMGLLEDEKGIAFPEEHILAVTFTVKAARQMAEKIRKLVRETGGDHRELSPYAYISNFHGLCYRVLRQHALDLDLTPEFGILSGLEQTLLRTRLLEGIRHGDYPDISAALNRAGLAGRIPPDILSLDALTRLRSGALDPLGVLIEDLPKVLDKIKSAGLSPREFYEVAMSQTKQFSEALKNLPIRDEFQQFLDSNEAYARLWTNYLAPWGDNHWSFLGTTEEKETFHAKKSLKTKSHDPSNDEPFYQENLKWLSKFEWDGTRRFVWYDGGSGKKCFFAGPEDKSFIDAVTAEELRYIDLVAGTYALYQQVLQEKNYCDFDDLINRTLELFDRRPELRAQYQEHFETLIVDEFQDSNGSQLQLMQQLMKPGVENMTVVGDLKQSIYSFRHAQPENMELIFNPKGRDEGRDIPLNINYRSRHPILQVANRMADDITGGDPQQQLSVCEQYAPSPDDPGVTWVELGIPKGYYQNGNPIPENIGDIRERETRYIAVEIARLIASGERQPSEIAVLVKKHDKATQIEAELRKLGVPAIKQKNKGFFSEPVILDALALLRLLHKPQDEMPLVRILQKKLSPRQLRLLADYRKAEKIPLFDALGRLETATVCPDIPLDVRQALLHLHGLILRRKAKLGQANLVSVFLDLADDLGLIEPDAPPDVQTEARMNINILKRLLYQLIRKGSLHPSLSEILDTLERYRNDPKLEVVSEENLKENAVQLMTIHTAKGLEFPVVFVAYTETDDITSRAGSLLNFDPQHDPKAGFGLFLGSYRDEGSTLKKKVYTQIWETPRAEVEEKRLFYVAVTRAMKKLYVIRATQTFDWTAAEHFPQDVLDVYREEADPEYFEDNYRNVDTETLRAQVREQLPRHGDIPASALGETANPPAGADEASPEPLVLSFSALNTHRQCPVQYMLKYAWGLPEPPSDRGGDAASSLAMARGSCLHALIEKHYRLKGRLADTVAEAIMAAFLPEPNNPDTLEVQRQRIRDTYRQFLASEYAYDALTGSGYRIETEKPLRFPLGSALIRGSLDLLLYHPGTGSHTLIDFKTNRELKPDQREAYFGQLLLYREGLKAVMADCTLPNDHLKLVHLTPEGLTSYAYKGTAGQYNPLAPTLKRIEAIDTLRQSGSLPERPADTDCQKLRCPYIAACPKA